MRYLDAKDLKYPETALRRDLERLRQRVEGFRKDPSTPDTRLADDSIKFNPASVDSLIELAVGGLPPKHRGKLLFARLRYFDSDRRRAGLPEGVAALIDRMTDFETAVTLVNTNQVEARTVIVQAGGYGEHEFVEVQWGPEIQPLTGRHLTVRLAPGAGQRLIFKMRRFANTPTLAFPWSN